MTNEDKTIELPSEAVIEEVALAMCKKYKLVTWDDALDLARMAADGFGVTFKEKIQDFWLEGRYSANDLREIIDQVESGGPGYDLNGKLRSPSYDL